MWLIIAGVLLVGMWLVLGLHALLRARGVKKSATDHGEKVYLYSKAVRLWHWSNALDWPPESPDNQYHLNK
ncbi:thiosulfate reductase cytochrome B subunit domain protein [Shigella dysenteriae 155-74]|nr:thiosulfate reductase cytochrome B subunit domain protein [Shigella dysenteriae 155-74]